MALIEKDKRTADTINRSRRKNKEQNKRGDREASLPRFKRLVDFQMVVGLRRGELEELTPEDLVTDESGYLCVRVKQGKGGKFQLQRVLPAHEQLVEATMTTDRPTVFTAEEMNNDIDLHSMRAVHGWECYLYYRDRLEADPAYKEELRRELLSRYDAFNPKATKHHREKFAAAIRNERPYRLRRNGKNYAIAIRDGKPLIYNRLSLLAVSVLHLSHWRVDVSVTNYILGGHE